MIRLTRSSAMLTALLVALLAGCTAAAPDGPSEPEPTASAQRADLPYLDTALPTADRVTDLADKVGQMTQAERSVVTPQDVAERRLGSVLSGVDAVHGNNNLAGATAFPHNIGLGATRGTLTWQGASGDIVPGTTILTDLQEALGTDAVTYTRDAEVIAAADDDVAVAVVGETPYAESEGDRPDGVALSPADRAVLDRLRASGVPTVVVVVSGRPMDVTDLLDRTDGLVAAWLPGSEGAGVADVLTGAVAPTGTLPVSRPVNEGDGGTPLFALGAGLTYGE